MARNPSGSPLRPRLPWLGLAPVVIAAGLASRRPPLAAWLPAEVGDALYAVLIVVLTGVLAPAMRPGVRAGLALGVCVAIEVSQAWHPAWLDALRATRLGALALGRGFLWADLVAYAVGVGAAWGVERAVRR